MEFVHHARRPTLTNTDGEATCDLGPERLSENIIAQRTYVKGEKPLVRSHITCYMSVPVPHLALRSSAVPWY